MRKNNKAFTLHSIWIAILVFSLVSVLDYYGVFQRAEWISYDWRMKVHRADAKAPDDIAVILIDETSLANLNPLVGRWPWPRSIHADVIEFLAAGNPRAIVLDILFSENELDMNDSRNLSENDRRLVEASGNGITFQAGQLLDDTEDEVNHSLLHQTLPDYSQRFSLQLKEHADIKLLHNNNKFSLPFYELINASQGLGIVNVSPDDDGIFRRIPMLHRYQNNAFPGLSTTALISSHDVINISEKRIEINKQRIPVDEKNQYLVNFYGNTDTYSMSGVIASAQSLQAGEVENLIIDPYEFENKIVFIGASAAGVEDLKATPLSSKTPGVMLHAATTANLMSDDFLKPTAPFYSLLLCLFLSLITTFCTILNKRIAIKATVPVMLFLAVGTSVFYLFGYNIVFPMVSPLLTIALATACALTYLVFTEGRDKRRIRTMLAQYVSPAVLTEVVDTYQDHLSAEVGQVQCLSILFSDIRGFTNLSENLPPSQLVEMLNFYFSKMTDAIFDHEGTIDKFIGDAIMAFWGAPINDPNHAKKSVNAAIAMAKRLEEVNQWLRNKSCPEINIGIGINTGDVVIGNIGSDRKLDYTVIGDNVNLASRLEGLTKPYGCIIILSEYTFDKLDNRIPCYVVDLVRVKGKQRPIRVYSPILNCEPDEAQRISHMADVGFQHYLDQNWQKAIDAYENMPNKTLREIFITRCEHYISNAPTDDWDGVHIMTSK